MPNSQDLNVLSICVELLESMDAGAALRITQFLHSKFNSGTSGASTVKSGKRGRPAKDAKKKRGRPAKVPTIIDMIPSDSSEPKKRGRPAKKKRGRPAKVVDGTLSLNNAAPIELKKRGRPAKKKRGRPAKTAPVIHESESIQQTVTAVKKRGRPAKKKRGRPAKSK